MAPTGSVRDCFLFNSYDSFDMVSTVTDWIDLPYTEKEIADGYYGMTGKVGWAVRMALMKVRGIDFGDFDQDNDGEIDAIAVIHSGYGAEAAEPDCQTGADPIDRIWSHKWNLDEDWHAPGSNTLVWKYHISPALWGSCNANIGRIGVICHETGVSATLFTRHDFLFPLHFPHQLTFYIYFLPSLPRPPALFRSSRHLRWDRRQRNWFVGDDGQLMGLLRRSVLSSHDVTVDQDDAWMVGPCRNHNIRSVRSLTLLRW